MSRMLRIAEICNHEIHMRRSVTRRASRMGSPRLLVVRVSLDIADLIGFIGPASWPTLSYAVRNCEIKALSQLTPPAFRIRRHRGYSRSYARLTREILPELRDTGLHG